MCPECALVRDLLVITYGSTEECCLIGACIDELENMSKCMLTMAELFDWYVRCLKVVGWFGGIYSQLCLACSQRKLRHAALMENFGVGLDL